jgi:inorganic pyrophosphatase
MEIDAVIEDPRGSTMRHHWDAENGCWITKRHPRSTTPWPANYGYLPGTHNPADGDELDTLVISGEPLATGSRVRVRVLGILHRPDGDDKILTAMIGDPATADMMILDDVPRRTIRAIEAWFAEWSDVGEWGDTEAASARLRAAMTDAERL